MAFRRRTRTDPEPIDAVFETAGDDRPSARAAIDAADARPASPPRARRSRSVTLTELMLASTAAAILGAVAAIAVTGASSGSSTGTLAQEIDTLSHGQTGLVARTDQTGADIVTIRSRLDAGDEQFAQRLAGERALTTELAALTAQVSALIGVGDGQPVPGATANASPLGALLGRINRLERIVRDDADAPRTTRQMQRTLNRLSEQAADLSRTADQLTAGLNRQQSALTALETGLVAANGDIAALRAARPASPASAPAAEGAAALPVGDPVLAAAAVARTLHALSAVEAAARAGRPFVNRQRALAILMPGDRDVAALAEIAARGAPSLDRLRRDFAVAARRADEAAARRSDDGWNWLRAAVSGVIALDRPGDADEAVATAIQSARRSIEVGDARGAVDALDGLGAVPPAFGPWRLRALRRIELDERLAILNARLTAPRPA